jgi:hypothetical protein
MFIIRTCIISTGIRALAERGVGAAGASAPSAGTKSSDKFRQIARPRNLNALPTTLTEDSAIAAAATIGDSTTPKRG